MYGHIYKIEKEEKRQRKERAKINNNYRILN
jgi:hypothetical protein